MARDGNIGNTLNRHTTVLATASRLLTSCDASGGRFCRSVASTVVFTSTPLNCVLCEAASAGTDATLVAQGQRLVTSSTSTASFGSDPTAARRDGSAPGR